MELLEEIAEKTEVSTASDKRGILPIRTYNNSQGEVSQAERVVYACGAVCKDCHCATYV